MSIISCFLYVPIHTISIYIFLLLPFLYQAGGVVRGLRNEEFVLKPGKGKVVCGNERVVAEVCDALAAADGRCNGNANGISNGRANGLANGHPNSHANSNGGAHIED